jgi:lipopolysaccharide export system protein LptA
MNFGKTSILTWMMLFPCLGNAPSSPGQPNIKILAEQMDCDQSQNVCIAKVNASAEKLNDPKTKILKADQIKAHFGKEGRDGSTKVTHLEADGHVFLILGDIIIQGERGDYVVDTEVAKVYDDVKITNGQNQVSGSYGEVNMKTGQYSVRRDGERVQALIYTKEDKPNK